MLLVDCSSMINDFKLISIRDQSCKEFPTDPHHVIDTTETTSAHIPDVIDIVIFINYLCKHKEVNFPFLFVKEHMINVGNPKSPTVDIAVISYFDNKCIFHVEGKILKKEVRKQYPNG